MSTPTSTRLTSTELESALVEEPVPLELPIALPLAHLTVARWIQSILDVGELSPRPCKVFSSNLIYFSYGGVFYRTSSLQTEYVTELPVAFVFSPAILDIIFQVFPFDSGAMASMRFGGTWSPKLAPFANRFAVNTTQANADVRRLVYHLFETNAQYIRGEASNGAAQKRDPFPLLGEFLRADLSALNVDHRQRTIEAISKVPIGLAKHLLWVGLPQFKISSCLRKLYQWTAPNLPQYYPYEPHKRFNPSEYAARLEEVAYQHVIKRFVDFTV